MKFGSVLDLGCGTGFAALPFRPFSDWMVGVDLSTAMLAQARAKGVYDRLIENEMLAFRQRGENNGALPSRILLPMPLCISTLAGAQSCCAGAGLASQLAFSVETHDDDDVIARDFAFRPRQSACAIRFGCGPG